MDFSSLTFIFWFIPIFLIIYYLVSESFRNPVLFLGSLIFYSLGSWQDALLLLFSLTLNYALVRLMDSRRRGVRTWILVLLLIYNIGLLAVFKYIPVPMRFPLGISFYTFSMLSYVIDVYREYERPLDNYVELGTYIFLFPKLISGPIVQYADVIDEIRERTIDRQKIEHGLSLFVAGLGFKIIIANHLAILWRDILGIGFESISTPLAWMGAIGFSAQLFFDFQGYSLMAIGLAEMLGFEFEANFDHPYRSRSVSEYYRRWHISLGAWFRDYVYIPLGGNRGSGVRTFCNLLAVWLITGIWHGVTANFLIWGLLLFAFIALEKFVLHDFLKKHAVISRMYILFVIPLTWVVFAIDNLKGVGMYFSRLFPFFGTGVAVNAGDYLKYGRTYIIFFIIGLLCSLPVTDRIWEKHWDSWWMKLFLLAVFWLCIYQVANGLNNPFMYFSF